MRDGHIHSPYCPHGSKDGFEAYIKNAIKVGINEITFTEHLPLPKSFKDPSKKNDSAMSIDKLDDYLNDVKILKKKYEGKIKINVGLEVDYLEGYEEYTKQMLDEIGEEIDDAILSVHILNIDEKYYCIDYDKYEFLKLANRLGGIDKLYSKYYNTVKKAINADLGKYKPKRLGHLNLVRKFNVFYPYDYRDSKELLEIVKLIKDKNYEVDYNISGIRKDSCKEAYIHGYLLELVKQYNITMVLGSDSHFAEDILSVRDFINSKELNLK